MHASVACHRKLCIDWIAASDLEDETSREVFCFHFVHLLLILLVSYLTDTSTCRILRIIEVLGSC